MLIPSGKFSLPFTCVDASGVPTAPTGTPTGVLVKNGTDLGTAVTVAMSAANGVASCAIPSDAVADDRFYIRITAVISAVTYTVSGPADSIGSPQTLTAAYDPAKTAAPTAAANATAVRSELTTELGRINATIDSRAATGAAMTLTSGERTTLAGVIETGFLDDLTGGAFLAGVQAQIEALFDAGGDVPVATIAAAVATAVRTNLAVELARIDLAISTRLAGSAYTAPTVPPTAGENAAAILVNPARKLLTDASGYVTATNGGGGGGSGSTQLVVPIVTEASGRLSGSPIVLFVGEGQDLLLVVKDSAEVLRDLSGLDLVFWMARPPASVRTLADLRSFELAAISDTDWEEVDSVESLEGNSDGEVGFPIPEFVVSRAGPLSCSLRDASTGEVLSRVAVIVQYAA